MNDAHLNALDLNLLRLFDVLMEERNVTRAGQRLGLTQSAVSHALNRLRFALKDELFVRAPEGMRPTPLASEAAPKIHQALAQIHEALSSAEFDPASSQRRFTVAVSAYVAEVLGPALFARLRIEAPNAELSLRPIGTMVGDALDSGRVDMAIASFARVPERLDRGLLFQDSMVWVLRADHPAAGEPLTDARLAQLPRLVISVVDEPDGGYVSEGGLERRVVWDEGDGLIAPGAEPGAPVCVVYDGQIALAVAERTDFASLVPLRLAKPYVDQGRLVRFDPPTFRAPAELIAVWRRDHGVRPAMNWFRTLLWDVAKQL